MTVHTGDVRGAGTNANVFLVMYGEKGKSDQFNLRNRSDNFERGQADKFKVSQNFSRNFILNKSLALLRGQYKVTQGAFRN